VWLGEARMRDGRRELAGYDARVFVSWNDVLGGWVMQWRSAKQGSGKARASVQENCAGNRVPKARKTFLKTG